jgi:bridging integrator 3
VPQKSSVGARDKTNGMSSWLKATQRRVKETILQSVGAHNKTDDLKFDEICHKFTNFSRDLVKVHMTMQLWLDSIDLFCSSWVGMGESLTAFCTLSSEQNSDTQNLSLHQLSKTFCLIGADVNSTLRGILKTIFMDRCLKPIESILAIVPIVNQKIQERKNVLLDVGFYKSKRQSELSSGKDPEHPSVVKLTNKLNESNRILETLSNDVISCVEELSYARANMLGPEIAALLACMETFPALIAQKVAQLHPLIPQTASTKCLLLASLEAADSSLKSNALVDSLRNDPSIFPVEPTLRRTGAFGGTSGGYGQAGFLEGLMSSFDTLMKQSSPMNSKANAADIEFRDSSTSRDSQSTRISSSSNFSDTSSTQTASQSVSCRVTSSTKRPIIKLGQDRPLSARVPFESSTESSSWRPTSAPKPSFVPPKPPTSTSDDSAEPGTRRIPSKRFTASALLMSGSPRQLLGAASIGEDDPDPDPPDALRWNGESSLLEEAFFLNWNRNDGSQFLYKCDSS